MDNEINRGDYSVELTQSFFFESAHTLRRDIEIEGSRRIHGHTYEAEVTIFGKVDPSTGMVMDLGHFRNEISRIREMLDHQFLDEIQNLEIPTLENLCLFIMKNLECRLSNVRRVSIGRRASGDKCSIETSKAK